MKVFISWSKRIGLEFALKTKAFLENLSNEIHAFVSEVDIVGGEDVQSKIIENINQCDKLVLCFTKDTKKSPWLLFEAGYARGCKKTVIPFLFDSDPNWHSWIDNPMNIAREISVDGQSFISEFLNSFGIEDNQKNRARVKRYHQEILALREKNRLIETECEDIISKLVTNEAFNIENPYFRDKTAFFLTGFESFELYKILTDSFLYSGKYLWIYGRKNMKLFSGNYNAFFDYLKNKAYDGEIGMEGIDFRCLFLDPSSQEVNHAYKLKDIFLPELKTSILRAKNVVNGNSILKESFRFYSNKREEIIIRIDNCILYSRPVFDANGAPQLLTNTAFEVFSAKSERGKECIKKFEDIWNHAREMS